MIQQLPGLVFALAAALATGAADAATTRKSSGKAGAKTVCWTDDKGIRMCGDSVPPEYAKGERTVRDPMGRVLETKRREKTPEEIVAEKEAAARAKEEKRLAAEQAAYDRFLLTTYSSVTELERARDERAGMLEDRLKLAQKAVVETETTLKTLRERIESAKAKGKDAPPKLAGQVVEFERALIDALRAVSTLKQERADVDSKFSVDIDRYRYLRSLKSADDAPGIESASPASGS